MVFGDVVSFVYILASPLVFCAELAEVQNCIDKNAKNRYVVSVIVGEVAKWKNQAVRIQNGNWSDRKSSGENR